MENLSSYLKKEGWKNDWQKTKEDFSPFKGKSLDELLEENTVAVKASSMLYGLAALFAVTGTIHLAQDNFWSGVVRYGLSGALIYFAGKKRKQGS